jgi:hypothetical protein
MFAASKSGRAVSGATTDPYFPYVPLLLNTTSTNGQQNNTFLDSSTNNFTITRNGTPTQGAFTPYQPSGYWSGYFGGSADGLKGSITSGVTPISGDFTWEGWIYFNSLSSAQCLIGVGNSQNRTILYFDNSTGLTYVVARSAANQILISQGSTSGWAVNTWYHFAVVRSGNNYTIYRNGTSIASGTSSYVASDLTQPLTVGYSDWSTSYLFTGGYISNVRAVYGTAIVPPAGGPTAPLTAVTGTSLLTLQDNRFKDNAATPNTMTVVGSTKVQAFQPFAPAASYSAATYGGSGYFGASTQYLTLGTNTAFNPGSGDFTFECWAYAISSPASSSLFEGTSNGLSVTFDATNHLAVANSGVAYLITDPATFSLTNQWVHIVAVRSGTNLSLYKNGSRVATSASNSTNLVSSTQNYIGLNGGSAYFPGYISNLRLVKGTAVYDPTQTTLTIPTTPVTAVSGTSLLTNFGNAGIYDAAWQNNALTVGDAQASTTQYKWSPTSMKFDGTGDWLTAIDSPGLQLGSGDFTIEGWVYLAATGVAYGLISKGTASTGWSVNVTSGNKLQFSYTSSNLTGATSLSATTWYYFAVVRSGSATGNLKVYLNGTADATSGGAVTDNFNQTSTFYIGADRVGGSALNGYLQDVRLTKGYARTVTTTPTAAFPTR